MPIARRGRHSCLTEWIMVKHVIVDGSNIATEGRSKPSLKQLHEAVLAFIDEHPKVAVTVIVDATFGHRIDPKEVPAFNKAVEHNELVTPPAGTVGRGDAFVLSIAEKAGASVLSNDSYQEFHGQYKWLFDEGRLIGGKPVPHVGWVFVERLPVRGEKSRLSERKAKSATSGTKASRSSRKVSAAALEPMPVPKTPPPGATLPAKKMQDAGRMARKTDGSKSVNEILPFLHFVERHGVGSVVEGIVESYSSHGAYVQIGDVRGYVPLRFLGSPPPRSAREAMRLGETISLEIVEIIASRRSVNLKPAATRASGRATPGKKLLAKKPSLKNASKDLAAKRTRSKATTAKKVATKKSPVKKTATKTSAQKASASQKSASNKTASNKTAPKKAATKTMGKVASKATVRTTTGPKKAATKKSPTKKSSTVSPSNARVKKAPSRR